MSSVKIENISKTRKRLVVPVAAAEVAAAEAEVIKSVSAEAQIQGFRPGKAPVAMVKAKYAKLIADEVQRKVVGDSYQKALKDAKLDLCSVVDIEGEPVNNGRNNTVTVIVDVYPEMKLPKYKGLEVNLPKVNVDETEVQKTIDLIRGQRAQFTPVEREAKTGDYVRIGYTGTLNGKAVSEILPEKPIYGTQKSTWEEAGEHEYGIKAITTGVIGMKKGDKKTVEEKFAKDFDTKELAGKAVKYELELHEVREKKMPEMDEAFFKSIGVENLEKLKEQIKSSLEARAKEEYENNKRTQLSDALVDAVGKIELPESLISSEQQGVMDELVEENQRRGVSEEVLKKNEKQLKESAKEAAEKRVKLRLVLRKVADEEKIEISQEDFQRWVMTEAMQRQVSPDKVVKELSGDREKASNLAGALRLGKAMQVVVDNAKVTETEAKKDEKKK